MLPIAGYADRWSVAPGQTIEFKVSSTSSEPYTAKLVRVVCGDPNPNGPGIKELPVPADFEGAYPSREQPVHLGSHCVAPGVGVRLGKNSFAVAATIWPTTPTKGLQGLVTCMDADRSSGFALCVYAGGVRAIVADRGDAAQASVGKPLRERTWYRVWMQYDALRSELKVGQHPLRPIDAIDDDGNVSVNAPAPRFDRNMPTLLAALSEPDASTHYNGKLERPVILVGARGEDALHATAGEDVQGVMACFDFSRGIDTMRVHDTGPHSLHGELVNLPARAMTGSNWTGEEMSWRHAPGQYGAIHFHDDDIYDCDWQTDFTFTVPHDLRSGPYSTLR